MDLNDYLSSINKDIQKDLEYLDRMQNDFLENILNKKTPETPSEIDNIFPNASTPTVQEKNEDNSIARLKLDRRLEESSKSKIGTFESIYNDTFFEDTRMPIASYGFNDLDYAPLVNLLGSILEIELNLSVYQCIRQKNGIDLNRFYDTDTDGPRIRIGEKTIKFGDRKQMLGSIQLLIEKEMDYLSGYIKDIKSLDSLLKKIIKTRNDASHTLAISKERFISFYRLYSELYNSYIFSILDLKERLKSSAEQQDMSYRLPTASYHYSAYDSDNDKSDDDYIRALFEDVGAQTDRECSTGIIMTDCSKLAVKYYGDIRNIDERIYNRFNEIIQLYSQVGIEYRLFDVNDEYAPILENNPGWIGYHKALEDYCRKHSISSDNPIGLFIIGGDDVIPMPKLDNPTCNKFSVRVLEETIDSDMMYAFDSNAVRVHNGNKLSWNTLIRELGKPRFYVGRLPLENGMMTTSFESDVYGYLERAVIAHSEGGVRIEAPTLTTCHSTKVSAQQMTEDIPLLNLPYKDGLFESDMIISPLTMLDTEKEEAIQTPAIKKMVDDVTAIEDCQKQYLEVLSQADMLIFLLHGGYNPRYPVYAGEVRYRDEVDQMPRRYQPATFMPSIFTRDNITIRSVAGVCCYGARFIDYERRDSSLLTAIHHDTLLFYGASRIAYGTFDEGLSANGGQTEYALVQMKYYMNYLLSGVQAGIAIQKAKEDYARFSITARKNYKEYETDCTVFMTTLLEFNLFGDPLLNVQKLIDIPQNIDESLIDLPDFVYDAREERSYQSVFFAGNSKKRSILDNVRELVDSNFESIHQKINETLYRHYSIDPRELHSVRKYNDGYGKSGYLLVYTTEDSPFDSAKFVDTDINGNINNIIETI